MVSQSLLDAQQKLSQQRQIIEQRRQEAGRASQQIREARSKLPEVTSQRALRSKFAGAGGREARMKITARGAELTTKEEEVRAYEGELGKAEQEVAGYEAQVSGAIAEQAAYDKVQKAAGQGMLGYIAMFGEGKEREIAQKMMKQKEMAIEDQKRFQEYQSKGELPPELLKKFETLKTKGFSEERAYEKLGLKVEYKPVETKIEEFPQSRQDIFGITSRALVDERKSEIPKDISIKKDVDKISFKEIVEQRKDVLPAGGSQILAYPSAAIEYTGQQVQRGLEVVPAFAKKEEVQVSLPYQTRGTQYYSSEKGFYTPTSFTVTRPSIAEFGGGVTKVAPYFIPYVGEALIISGGTETIMRTDTTIPQKVLGGVAVAGGAFGLYSRTIRAYDKNILKVPKDIRGETEIIYGTTMKTQNVPRAKIIEIAGKEGRIPKIVKGGKITTLTPTNARAVTLIKSPSSPGFRISEIADEAGNVLGVMEKAGKYVVKYKVTPQGTATYNIFRGGTFYKTITDTSGKFLGYVEPSIISKVKGSTTKTLPGKIKLRLSEQAKTYSQEIIPLEKTTLKIKGGMESTLRTERATIITPAKQEQIYQIEKFLPQRQSIKFVATKIQSGKFSNVQPPDLQIISGRKVKLGTQPTVTVYHGTTDILAKDIKLKGLVPAKTSGIGQGVAGKLDDVFVTVDKKAAEGWAARAAYGKGVKMGTPEVLRIEVPKKTFEAALKKQGGILPGGELRLPEIRPEMIVDIAKQPKVASVGMKTLSIQTPRFEDIIVQTAQGRGEFTIIRQNALERYLTSNIWKSKKATSMPLIELLPKSPGKTFLDTRVSVPSVKPLEISTDKFKTFLPGATQISSINVGTIGLLLPQTKIQERTLTEIKQKQEIKMDLKPAMETRIGTGLALQTRQKMATRQTTATLQELKLMQLQKLGIGLGSDKLTKMPRQEMKPKKRPEIITLPKMVPPPMSRDEPRMKIIKGNVIRQMIDIFARKKGKDILIAKARTAKEAGEFLKKRLKGTLAASGFAQTTKGEKLTLKELEIFGPEFRPAKRDAFRVVQKRGYRLGTRSEIREIMGEKRRKTKSRRIKYW